MTTDSPFPATPSSVLSGSGGPPAPDLVRTPGDPAQGVLGTPDGVSTPTPNVPEGSAMHRNFTVHRNVHY